ncbi:hypothetical protein PCASD_14342 [Puccinia coronata f. sp. avenae]|uniref:Uncharacterized protein n=1 Tax=Puccinia coronata f. sp. avenae TaxID=200324 RepID=A0A2N5U3S0_9BASI|nr:hypothetical protein PCASD_17718 [Puccinia coronata f. sp. avenae]PLW32381.1 hypothetical protein PCASD_14342 [Puccinia coronata f. sp. avenae]
MIPRFSHHRCADQPGPPNLVAPTFASCLKPIVANIGRMDPATHQPICRRGGPCYLPQTSELQTPLHQRLASALSPIIHPARDWNLAIPTNRTTYVTSINNGKFAFGTDNDHNKHVLKIL